MKKIALKIDKNLVCPLCEREISDIPIEKFSLERIKKLITISEQGLEVDKKEMKIERIWSRPSKWTFRIKPIAKLLKEEMNGLMADPFAGKNSPAQEQNDIQEDCGNLTADHKDALEWLKGKRSERYDTILYDPPYSITQARQYGKKEFSSMRYWADCKNEIARIIKPSGKAICFGWNSMGLGKNRGFEIKRLLIVCHGGSRNDTLVTVEIKL